MESKRNLNEKEGKKEFKSEKRGGKVQENKDRKRRKKGKKEQKGNL